MATTRITNAQWRESDGSAVAGWDTTEPRIAYDTVTRGDNVSDPGTATSGHAWTALAGTWGVASNRLYCSTTATQDALVLEASAADNLYVRAELSALGAVGRWIFRAVDDPNYLLLQANGDGYALYKRVASAFTQLGATIPQKPGPGDIPEIEVRGSTIKVWLNGFLRLTVTDTTHQAATKHGLGCSGVASATRYDNFAVSRRRLRRVGAVVFDGNSMTYGYDASILDPYPCKVIRAVADPLLAWYNAGVSSQTTTDMAADAATEIDTKLAAKGSNVCVVWEGTNDLYFGANAATAYADLVSYCQARQAAGWKVVILTILPRTQGGLPADFETSRTTVNTNIRNNWATFADALADVAANGTIGDAGDELNLTYYIDGIHPTDAGYEIIAGIVSPAVTGLL